MKAEQGTPIKTYLRLADKRAFIFRALNPIDLWKLLDEAQRKSGIQRQNIRLFYRGSELSLPEKNSSQGCLYVADNSIIHVINQGGVRRESQITFIVVVYLEGSSKQSLGRETFRLHSSTTVGELLCNHLLQRVQNLVGEHNQISLSVEQLALIYNGNLLKEEQQLENYNLQDRAEIVCLLKGPHRNKNQSQESSRQRPASTLNSEQMLPQGSVEETEVLKQSLQQFEQTFNPSQGIQQVEKQQLQSLETENSPQPTGENRIDEFTTQVIKESCETFLNVEKSQASPPTSMVEIQYPGIEQPKSGVKQGDFLVEPSPRHINCHRFARISQRFEEAIEESEGADFDEAQLLLEVRQNPLEHVNSPICIELEDNGQEEERSFKSREDQFQRQISGEPRQKSGITNPSYEVEEVIEEEVGESGQYTERQGSLNEVSSPVFIDYPKPRESGFENNEDYFQKYLQQKESHQQGHKSLRADGDIEGASLVEQREIERQEHSNEAQVQEVGGNYIGAGDFLMIADPGQIQNNILESIVDQYSHLFTAL